MYARNSVLAHIRRSKLIVQHPLHSELHSAYLDTPFSEATSVVLEYALNLAYHQIDIDAKSDTSFVATLTETYVTTLPLPLSSFYLTLSLG